MVHLVYCDNKEKVLEKIMDGSKTMVVRGAAVVKEVQNYVKLSDEDITKTLQENQEKLNLSVKQQDRWHK